MLVAFFSKNMHDFSLFRYNRGVVMDALRAMGRADGAIGRRKAPMGRLVEAIGRPDGLWDAPLAL